MGKQRKFTTSRLDGKNYEYVGNSDNQSKRPRIDSSEEQVNLKQKLKIKIKTLENSRIKNNVKIMRQPKKIFQALNLPKIMNVNPRSAMNKIKELRTFIKQKDIDCAFISESFDRENKKLEENFILENFKVISNIFQRREVGGCPLR